MRRIIQIAVLVLLPAIAAGASERAPRAWQQRLAIPVPLVLPSLPLDAANPFFTPLDQPPALLSQVPPRKVDVAGRAQVAAYVDENGDSPGGVPLALPFPGLTSTLVEELQQGSFEPARIGNRAVRSWTVLEMTLAGTVREGQVLNQNVELTDPAVPPALPAPAAPAPAGRLAALPAEPPARLSTPASPRRLRVRIPGREIQTTVRALLHVTPDGMVDAYVPLELEEGLRAWLEPFLGSFRFAPAERAGGAVDAWVVWEARLQLKMSSLDASAVRAVPGGSFSPAEAPPSAATPGAG